MERYLIDTNVVSDYFSSSLPEDGLQLMDQVINAVPNLSVITQIELLSWKISANIEEKVTEFITDSVILDLKSEIVNSCIRLRRNHMAKTPDAIIAVTALVNEFTLITNNEKDFPMIANLKIINPHSL